MFTRLHVGGSGSASITQASPFHFQQDTRYARWSVLRGKALRRAAGGGDALPALDADGNAVTASKWLAKHPAGDRNLVQGLKSDATYLIGDLQYPLLHLAGFFWGRDR